jgi:hypothetical protein
MASERNAMLPKLIHFVWLGPLALPPWAEANVERFRRLNPDYEIRIHGEEALLPEFRALYNQCTMVEQRADLILLGVLLNEGGWYFDCDYLPLRPVDDIVSAYGLDGSRFFTTEQHHQKGAQYTIANGAMACAPQSPGIEAVVQAVLAHEGPVIRCSFGPILIGDVLKRRPDLFVVGPWPWFYPLAHGHATRAWRSIMEFGGSPAQLASAESGWQIPFVVHLWANAQPNLPIAAKGAGELALLEGKTDGPLSGLRFGMSLLPEQWEPEGPNPGAHCFRSIAQGLLAQGAQSVEVVSADPAANFATSPHMIFIWNGRRENYKPLLDRARRSGQAVIRMEHGFFDRGRYTQADHEGILHWSSWAQALGQAAPIPVPQGARDRLAAVWLGTLADVKARRGGYVLVLGQVPGDTQLEDSEISLPKDVCRMVASWLPRVAPGVKAVFRGHPKAPTGVNILAAQAIRATVGGTLEEAVAGARFVVLINSNSANEALAWGCPVLAFGPAVGIQAGVVRKAGIRTFAEDLKAMLAGWAPDPERVKAYLALLAARQWSNEEFADGRCLGNLIRAAGVQTRQDAPGATRESIGLGSQGEVVAGQADAAGPVLATA